MAATLTEMVTKPPVRHLDRLYLTEWREYFGLSVEGLAERLNVSRQAVFRWENGQRQMNPFKMILVAGALGIRAEQLWQPPPAKPGIRA